MGKIVCELCGTEFKFEVAKNFKNCPVCGAAFEDGVEAGEPKEKQTYYYYDSGTLDTTLFSHRTPLYIFEAVDMEDAERQLKKVLPNSPLFQINSTSQKRCPYCYGTQIQLVPKRFSILTGFATSKVERMCVRCQKRF